MEIEITTGFLMYWGGIALSAFTVVGTFIYLAATSKKAKKLLKKIDEEDI